MTMCAYAISLINTSAVILTALLAVSRPVSAETPSGVDWNDLSVRRQARL